VTGTQNKKATSEPSSKSFSDTDARLLHLQCQGLLSRNTPASTRSSRRSFPFRIRWVSTDIIKRFRLATSRRNPSNPNQARRQMGSTRCNHSLRSRSEHLSAVCRLCGIFGRCSLYLDTSHQQHFAGSLVTAGPGGGSGPCHHLLCINDERLE